MKKFLTVLLALSVVFTYTVGTAFALPSDETTEAGLKAAKDEAIAELNAYDLSDYSAADQAIMKGIIAKAIEKINDAVSVTYGYEPMPFVDGKYTAKADTKFACYHDGFYEHGMNGNGKEETLFAKTYVVANFEGYFTGVKVTENNLYIRNDALSVENVLKDAKDQLENDFTTTSELEDAKKAAVAQFNDYVYLFEKLGVATTEELNKATSDAKVGAATDYKNFKDRVVLDLNLATNIDAVEKALDAALVNADKIFAQLEEVTVPQDAIDNLVKEIRKEAAEHKVNSATHSATIVNAYEKAIEEGVAAAKAVNTWADYYKVYDKYLGAVTGVEPIHDDVIIHMYQLSVFEQYENKTKEVEAEVKAVEKLLAALGEYNWKDYAGEANWLAVENFYYQAKYFVENGEYDNKKATPIAIPALRTTVKADSSTNTINGAVDTAYKVVKEKTALGEYKDENLNILKYKGTTIKTSGVEKVMYLSEYGDNKSLVESLQTLGANAIASATTIEAAKVAYADYAGRIDAVDTKLETEYANKVKAYDELLNNYLEVHTETDLSTEEKLLLDRYVVKVKEVAHKALQNENNKVPASLDNEYVGNIKLADVVKGNAPYNANDANSVFNFGIYDSIAFDQTVKEHMDIDRNAYWNKMQTLTKWSEFFDLSDDTAIVLDKYLTKTQEEYIDAVKAFNEAVTKLGTPVLTAAYKAQLDKLKVLYGEYVSAAEAFFDLDADEQAEVKDVIEGEEAYLNAQKEYDRLAYLDKYTEPTDGVAEVGMFFAIAKKFVTDAEIRAEYDNDGKQEIAQIVEDTYKAIAAASTADAKAEAALAGIAKLDAVALDNSNAQNIADKIAEIKAEAAKYFDKYEGAVFTSDATTKLDLVKDIIAFNAKFYQSVADAKAELIKDIKGTHMKIGSSAAKGYIRISWKQSNSTVALDGVKVYRSTKKTSGFKLISTFKKQTAKKYTTNLKKGTKYYYKVKGYKVIDGVTYYTHESITVGRTFR